VTAEFTPATRRLIIEREGSRCAVNYSHPGEHIHHRRPRGMGGTDRPGSSRASNGVLLCACDHRAAETDRAAALDAGLLVSQDADPAEVPVLYRGHLVLLDDDGCIDPRDPGKLPPACWMALLAGMPCVHHPRAGEP